MPKYKTLLFDLDDTLLDFTKSEASALKQTFLDYEIPFDEEISHRYHEINRDLWNQYARGEKPRGQILVERFDDLFSEFHIDSVPGREFEAAYRSNLGKQSHLLDGAYELIEDLSRDFELYIVTNGVFETQKGRMAASGLRPFFKDVFVSDQTGYKKPDREFFDYCFQRIENFDPKQTIIIGDSLTSDIAGGQTAGIATCWVNPEGRACSLDIDPDHVIKTPADFYGVLGLEGKK